MPRKENTKAITWERDRRKRMNVYFKGLADLLPPQQEGRKRNKVDILLQATKYIKDLHSRMELYTTNASEAHKEELSRLKKLVAQLFSRTQLLSTLLKDADITVPAEPALEKLSGLKWSNKINLEDVDKHLESLEEKRSVEKKNEKPAKSKVPSKKKSIRSCRSSSRKLAKSNDAGKDANSSIEDQENRVNCANNKNDGIESSGTSPETGSKDKDSENDSNLVNDTPATCTLNRKKKKVLQKVDSPKKVKRKTRKQDKKKPPAPCIKNTVTNFTPSTLILSGGKLMPLVTPMTSNIIVNTQTQPANPIILGNAQQNQMFVMQPVTNHVQNSVVSISNQSLISTVQKVTLNTVPSIGTKMVVDSQNWASNVKNIINATKIGRHKGILPKGKEVTKTTMTYKVPIPAVHREKPDKPKESSAKKETDSKAKSNKSHSKVSKDQQTSDSSEAKNGTVETAKKEDVNSQKGSLKRSLAVDNRSVEEPGDKRRKTEEKTEKLSETTAEGTSSEGFTTVCSISENITGMDTGKIRSEGDPSVQGMISSEKRVSTDTPTQTSPVISADDKSPRDSSLPINILATQTETMNQIPISGTISSASFSADNLKENHLAVTSPATENQSAKSPLTEIEGKIKEVVDLKKTKEVCSLGSQFDSLLQVTKGTDTAEASTNLENNKIILNLDTNTTTTLKPESSRPQNAEAAASTSTLLPASIVDEEQKIGKTPKDEIPKSLSYNTENTFVPITNRTDGLHSDLSNDIFASLQVPSSSHNPESISPTAAFLMAFPLVSSLNGKTEVLDEEMKEDFKYHSQTPPMLLQIGTIEPNSFKIKSTSPPHTIAEKRLKISCEEKKIEPSENEPLNTTIIPQLECTQPTKALPKIVNNETLREPFKIVQTVLTPAIEKAVTSSSSFPHSMQSVSVVSSQPITTNTVTSNTCQPDLPNTSQTPISIPISNTRNASSGTSQLGVTLASAVPKTESIQIPLQNSNCDTSTRYSSSQDFLRCYSTVVDTNLRNLQQTSVAYSHSTISDQSASLAQNVLPHTSHSSLISHLNNTTLTTNTSSLSLPSLTIDYPPQLADKDTTQANHQVDTCIVPNSRVSYTNHLNRILPPSSQSRQDYSMQTKDASLPILSSQTIQPLYDAQPKDSHMSLTTIHNSQQSYPILGKDHRVPCKETISYSSSAGNTNTPAQNRNFNTKETVNSSDSHFQRTYPKLCKNPEAPSNPTVDQGSKLNDVLRTKPSEQQDHHQDSYSTSKKVQVDPFSQSFSYGVKEPINTQAEQNVVLAQTAENIFQEKREDSQNYGPYVSKDMKKINTSTSNTLPSKSLVQNISLPRYPQQPVSFVATSNYEQSSVSDNNAKSTTTVAHNSSNFSILSWTTFSPVSGSGNNNLVHFEQGPSHQNDTTEGKTICENYNYVPLHKENPGFSNILPNDSYPVNSTIPTMDKTRLKSGLEAQKQPFVDPSKSRSIQGTVPVAKNNRMQTQNQASSGTDYKYGTDAKNKTANKFGMDSDYLQSEYPTIDQHSQQQHGPKDHQTMPPKQDKAIYTMPSYDPQVSFDLPEVSSQMKYSVDAYATSNFKYTDKSQQQNKYQAIIQSQVQPLHETISYNTNDGKHNQQQNTTKSKGNQQQHTMRPPVNWMMTPEIKHNTNIADIILPPIGKELEFCQNNLFGQTPSYNQGTPNQFYNNYDVAAHSFPNLPVLQSDPKRTTDVFYSEEQPFPWSPTKSSVHIEPSQTVKGIDQHIVPSTLPTLVGDLELGTNIPEKQNFLFGQVPSRVPTEQTKDPIKDKEGGNVTNRDFHNVLNTQNVQHPGAGSSFLSVSQLVDHEKAEKSHQQHQQQHHHHHHHHHHPHQHPHQQQQQQQQQQARKHQRKANTSPRGNSKRQMDIRKQTSNNDQLHQRHEEQKSSNHTFSEQTYQQQQQPQQQQPQQQQQKYQQNNSLHWRSRNCKSNYTAEALIGTNNSVHETNHQDKHASIKFTPNYSQNKFQTSLPSADSVMPINYFSNTDDGSGYGQMVNQNFNSYAYTSNTNIYPTTNFITSISNTPTTYMMPLHDNTDYMEAANAFLLPNVAVSSTVVSSSSSTITTSSANASLNSNPKNHQHYAKQQNCDKRNYSNVAKKGKRKGLDGAMQNLEFPLSGISSPLEDYHHSTSFLPPPPPHASPLYQNHAQANVYSKAVNGLPPPPVASSQGVPAVASAGFPMNPNMPRGGSIVSSNPMSMNHHHPSGTSLTNFNLSTIFPEMNDKITGYKPPNAIAPGLSQASNQSSTYTQRPNYPTNSLCHLPQVSEGSQFGNGVPPPPPPGVLHYKNV